MSADALLADSDNKLYLAYLEDITRVTQVQTFALDCLKWQVDYEPWKSSSTPDTFSLPDSYVQRTFCNIAFVRQRKPCLAFALGLCAREGGVADHLADAVGQGGERILAPFSIDADDQFYTYLDEPDASELAAAMGFRELLRSTPSLGPQAAIEAIPKPYRHVMDLATGTPDAFADLWTKWIAFDS